MQWKKQQLDSLPTVFADKRIKDNKDQEEKEAQPYQQIGQLKVELESQFSQPKRSRTCYAIRNNVVVE